MPSPSATYMADTWRNPNSRLAHPRGGLSATTSDLRLSKGLHIGLHIQTGKAPHLWSLLKSLDFWGAHDRRRRITPQPES